MAVNIEFGHRGATAAFQTFPVMSKTVCAKKLAATPETWPPASPEFGSMRHHVRLICRVWS